MLVEDDPARTSDVFNLVTNAGSDTGAQGTASVDNLPGSRYGSTRWLNSNGIVWLFGDYGIDVGGSEGWLNDL